MKFDVLGAIKNFSIYLRDITRKYIEKFLIAPNTANFKNENYYINKNKNITITGTVEDAKNLFGIDLEIIDFELLYKKEYSDFILIKAMVAGEVVYNVSP